MDNETLDAVTRAWERAAHREPRVSGELEIALRTLPNLTAWVVVPMEEEPILLGVSGTQLLRLHSDKRAVEVSHLPLHDVHVSVRHEIVEEVRHRHRYLRTWTFVLPDLEPIVLQHEQDYVGGSNIDGAWERQDRPVAESEGGCQAILAAVLSTTRS